ncbi:hypothetical protein FYJ24_09485 [Actinomycetaceae bacterium WB03_NA08]|uniref:Uncharacterized protein n=1 Tax=Scrofimicrobium canadense TaxID=2652290 RepID=A0A6N7W6I0_9ACTO|nr:hypothetical protein [Scrofimicrobium canadense]MSS84991.1 hypothetical protein [Scrofimicrobium canadense]
MSTLFDAFDPTDLPAELHHLLSPENLATEIPREQWEDSADYGRGLRALVPISSGTATNKDCRRLQELEYAWLHQQGVPAWEHTWFTAKTDTGVHGQWANSPEEAAMGITFWWQTTITNLYADPGNRLYDHLRKQERKEA